MDTKDFPPELRKWMNEQKQPFLMICYYEDEYKFIDFNFEPEVVKEVHEAYKTIHIDWIVKKLLEEEEREDEEVD